MNTQTAASKTVHKADPRKRYEELSSRKILARIATSRHESEEEWRELIDYITKEYGSFKSGVRHLIEQDMKAKTEGTARPYVQIKGRYQDQFDKVKTKIQARLNKNESIKSIWDDYRAQGLFTSTYQTFRRYCNKLTY